MTKAEQVRVTAWRLKILALGARRAALRRTGVPAFRHLANRVLPLETSV